MKALRQRFAHIRKHSAQIVFIDDSDEFGKKQIAEVWAQIRSQVLECKK